MMCENTLPQPSERRSADQSGRITPDWRNSALLEEVFERLPEAVILYDPSLVVTGVNRAAERLFGVNASQLIGHHCKDLFGCGCCEGECGVSQGLIESVPHCTLRLRTRPGRERLAILSSTQLTDENGHTQGAMVVIADVSEEVSATHQEIVAESQAMRNVMIFVRRVAMSEASTILIEGENGTGKDLVAKTLHYQSRRREGPFIAINCAAIPETLLESEMFGYEKGAFTDAKAQKKGLFELADAGTLFLDEIGEIPLVLQAKLLRVLEEQTMRRLGGVKDITVDVRVVAATNKDLREAVKEKAFRQDLYFRLNVIQVTIPPLRERPDDIVPLAEFFIEHFNRKFKRRIEGLTGEARETLLGHPWPGNVRELRNAMERAMILEESLRLTASSLPIVAHREAISIAPADNLNLASAVTNGSSWYETERRLLASALTKSGGNQSVAARLLGITRDKLRYQMKKFDIKPHNN